MSRFRTSISRVLTSDDGPTAVEYAVLLALNLVACIGTLTRLGTSISSTFSTVNTCM
jgi:pilus assembly protein Flp/PilA